MAGTSCGIRSSGVILEQPLPSTRDGTSDSSLEQLPHAGTELRGSATPTAGGGRRSGGFRAPRSLDFGIGSTPGGFLGC